MTYHPYGPPTEGPNARYSTGANPPPPQKPRSVAVTVLKVLGVLLAVGAAVVVLLLVLFIAGLQLS